MRHIWNSEVRYYKYALFASVVMFFCGVYLLDYDNQLTKNQGIIINIIYIKNLTIIIPIYKIKKENNIYNIYDKCVLENNTNCHRFDLFTINSIIYFEKINGLYVVSEKNNFLLHLSVFFLTFSIGMILIICVAYFEFNRVKRKEFKISQKQKKYDLLMTDQDCHIESFLYY
jgi:hypothetical protein